MSRTCVTLGCGKIASQPRADKNVAAREKIAKPLGRNRKFVRTLSATALGTYRNDAIFVRPATACRDAKRGSARAGRPRLCFRLWP